MGITIQQRPAPDSLFGLAAAVYINNKIHGFYQAEDRNFLNFIAKIAWDRLKHSQLLMQSAFEIENSLIQNLNDKGQSSYTAIERETLLQENVDALFKNLAKEFDIREEERIPADASSYEFLQRAQEDESLQTIWKYALRDHFKFNGKQPETLVEIKNWLADSKNSDQLNNIDGLELSDISLKAIPPEITKFFQLQGLLLDNNELKRLPEILGNLSNLEVISAKHNKIRSLPESLGNLAQLTHLSFFDNKIRILPEIIGNLSKLQEFYIDKNELKSLPETIGNLSQLKELSVDKNELRSLPESIGNLSNLKILSLNYNQLKSLPESFGKLSHLDSLALNYNKITGLPTSFINLSKLEDLLLCGNEIETLPPWNNFSHLQRLLLRSNKISVLSESLGQLSQLQALSLGNNHIKNVPESLGNLSHLLSLSLDFNRIEILPESLGNLTQLETFFLDNNEIESLPESLGNLSELQKLTLCNNKIKEIPESFGNFSQLQDLSLRNNKIRRLPESLGNLFMMHNLCLSNNEMRIFPEFLGSLAGLQMPCLSLSISDNPLLFVLDKNSNSEIFKENVSFRNIGKIGSISSEFREYLCLSQFSRFYKFITLNDQKELIKKEFHLLNPQDQELIFEMVYGKQTLQSEDNGVFHDINLFSRAVKKSVLVKFDRLTAEQKSVVYKKIHEIANPKTTDSRWGEFHAFDNALRLIDAMDGVTQEV